MKNTTTKVLRTNFIIISLMALSSCGLKGPLVLDQIPVDKTQAPVENGIDSLPVETPVDAAADEAEETATTE